MRASNLLPGLSLLAFLAACSPTGDTSGEGGSSTEVSTGGGGAGGAAGGNGTGGETGGGGAGGNATGGGGTGGGSNNWGPEQCPEAPDGVIVGLEVGQQLPELSVWDCDGTEYSLSEFCGANGLWLFAAFGWCPLCQNVSTNAEAIHDGFAAQGHASAIIVVETGASQPPDADYCKLWRDRFGLEDVVTLYDPTGGILELWPGPSSSLSAFVDSDRVIVSKLYHDGNVETIKTHIQEALDH